MVKVSRSVTGVFVVWSRLLGLWSFVSMAVLIEVTRFVTGVRVVFAGFVFRHSYLL